MLLSRSLLQHILRLPGEPDFMTGKRDRSCTAQRYL
jgi:hypothetical protein